MVMDGDIPPPLVEQKKKERREENSKSIGIDSTINTCLINFLEITYGIIVIGHLSIHHTIIFI